MECRSADILLALSAVRGTEKVDRSPQAVVEIIQALLPPKTASHDETLAWVNLEINSELLKNMAKE